VPLKTNKGLICPGTSAVYLTPQYGNKTDLELDFPSYPHWSLVNDCYLDSSGPVRTREAMLSWRRFLISLGCTDTFNPQPRTSTDDSGRSVVDYVCPVFEFYAGRAADLVGGEEMTNLFRLVEKNWTTLGQFKCKSVNLIEVAGEDSSYFLSLKRSRWILAEIVEFRSVNGASEAVRRRVVECPDRVYVKEPVFLRYFGDLVPYAFNKPSGRSELCRELALRSEFRIDEFVGVVREWWCSEAGKEVHASVGQMKSIYTLLFGNYLTR